jgi:hypothetical protein
MFVKFHQLFFANISMIMDEHLDVRYMSMHYTLT